MSRARAGCFNDVERGLHDFGADAVAVRDCNRDLLAHCRLIEHHINGGLTATAPLAAPPFREYNVIHNETP